MFTTYRTPVSYYSVLLELGTQTRFLQIINTIMTLNQEAQNVTKLLEKLVAQNKHKSRYGSDIWMPYTPREYEQLNLLRLLYGRLYKAYGCADDCFAWCILLFIMEKFFFLVCNLYWCAQMFFEEPTIFKIFYNLSSTLKAGFQIVVLCAISSEVENYSRYIGCLISRLPKPLGNKPYNDLVTNFSIQTLHQQFSIKAKHFCVLNRTLLGSVSVRLSPTLSYSFSFCLVRSRTQFKMSRQIGCNMYKLIKPSGNKSYNELVTDFSLQVLHQEYTITAKEFFNLNLNLLGSMIASTVTYLVILVQFMFADKNKAEPKLIVNSFVNSGNTTIRTSE
ncbi:gustatory receptor 23a-like [Anastrepha ludens]|uniref:gustatory receptor 23a-like n=1 Tax=Anastrepha ludens TaxID=28586 RepID=UPI0023B111D9|nr:gustatory receptor 23a-like [Anastrepha ludens]